jgi:CheY-like chemotaxis protein
MDSSGLERNHLPFRRGERRRKPFSPGKMAPSTSADALIAGIFPREARFPVRGVVLLVVPDAPLRWSLGNTLVNEGYSVAEAATLAQAIALLEKVSFDALLLDLTRPDEGIWELPPRLIEATALTTPLILLPTGPLPSLEERLLPLGTALPQALWEESLLRVLERVIPLSGSPGRVALPPRAAAREG